MSTFLKVRPLVGSALITWQASSPFSPPAQKLEAGRMNIFSVTLLIFLTHSLSFTIGTRASRILRGMGPAKDNNI